MDVLVYINSGAAEGVAETLRNRGVRVGIRNPDYFTTERGQFEPAASVIVDSAHRNAPAIIAAYKADGAQVCIVGALPLSDATAKAKHIGNFTPAQIASGAPFALIGR